MRESTTKPSKHQLRKDDIQTLKEAVDLDFLVESLGFNIERDNSKEIRATCAIHGGDNRSAFRLNREKRTWVCFTHKCHEIHGNDLIGLIEGALGTNFIGAVEHLKELVGDVSAYKDRLAARRFKQERQKFLQQYAKVKPSYVSEDALSKFKHFRSPYFLSKGFAEDTLDYFEVAGGYTDSHKIVRDIVPIRDVKGELVAYSMRDIRENAPKEHKYILSDGFAKDSVLYNLNNARLFGTDFPIIVVEGFKSVWRLYEYGIYNVVATMGAAITEGQVRLLKAYALKGAAVMFDPDTAGKDGAEGTFDANGKILREGAIHLLKPHMPVDIVKMLPSEGEDPADLTLEQAYGYLNGYIR